MSGVYLPIYLHLYILLCHFRSFFSLFCGSFFSLSCLCIYFIPLCCIFCLSFITLSCLLGLSFFFISLSCLLYWSSSFSQVLFLYIFWISFSTCSLSFYCSFCLLFFLLLFLSLIFISLSSLSFFLLIPLSFSLSLWFLLSQSITLPCEAISLSFLLSFSLFPPPSLLPFFYPLQHPIFHSHLRIFIHIHLPSTRRVSEYVSSKAWHSFSHLQCPWPFNALIH